MKKPKSPICNVDTQFYKGIPLNCIQRWDYHVKNAKRFVINHTNQNVWIPNKHLMEDGTIKSGENLDYVFRSHQRQLELAGLTGPIIGIKRRTVVGGKTNEPRGQGSFVWID